jgi:hypothetical protein
MLHPGCDEGRNRFVAAAKAAMPGGPTRLGGLYYRVGYFDSRMFVARRFHTTLRSPNGLPSQSTRGAVEPVDPKCSIALYIEIANSDRRALPIGIGKYLGGADSRHRLWITPLPGA